MASRSLEGSPAAAPRQRRAGGRPRLDDVAAAAGVSTGTVSLVMRGRPGPSEKTRERVLRAAARLGYRTDRSASLLARRRSQVLGVSMDVANPFHAELLEDIQVEAAARGFDVVVSPLTRVHGELQTALNLADQRCEAAILLGPALGRAELAELAEVIPLVVVGRRLSSLRGVSDALRGVSVVRAADDRGVGQAVRHLVALGHRSIGFVDGPPGPIATLRRDGFRRATSRPGVELLPAVIPGGDTEEAGMAAPLGSQTALIAFNDRCALGVMDQLRASGRSVPDDVSVVGFDDSPIARLRTVSLTSVSQSPDAMAAAAVEAAVSRAEGGEAPPKDVVLEPRLVVRATTRPPAGQRSSTTMSSA